MAVAKHSVGDLPRIDGAKVVILQGAWHKEITSSLVNHATRILEAQGAYSTELHVLPGCLELPLAAQTLATHDPSIEAFIAFGIILKGDTDHYEVVRNECMRGLMDVSLKFDVPIINEVLPVHKIEHATARCSEDDHNKGIEAAVAAVHFVAWSREIEAR